jgi:photosystem II stability/assembly factor-like uncharacterized protein
VRALLSVVNFHCVTIGRAGISAYKVIEMKASATSTMYLSHRAFKLGCHRVVIHRSIASLAIAFLLSCMAGGESARSIQGDYGYSISPHQVSDLFFIDNTHGWMIVEDHTRTQSFLLKTADGGKTWSERKAPKGIIRLNFLSARIGWALVESVADGGKGKSAFYLARTTDGGDSWISSGPIVEAAEGMLTDVAFIDEKHGWVVGSGPFGSGLVLDTIDAGKSFHKLPDVSDSIKPRDILASEKEGIWLYGLGSVLHSSDNGKTWEDSVDLQKLGTNANAFDISSAHFWNNGKGLLAGQDPDAIILGTEDFGQHWKVALRTKEAGNFHGMSFWDEKHGCSASVYPVLLFCTDDGGLTWKSRDVLPQAIAEQAHFFMKLVMLKSGRGWALRAGGYLYQTTDRGQSWHDLDTLEKLKLGTPK